MRMKMINRVAGAFVAAGVVSVLINTAAYESAVMGGVNWFLNCIAGVMAVAAGAIIYIATEEV